jgi:cell division protein FtsQ
MEMVPSIGQHIVELGDGTEPEAMLARLKIFYKAMARAGMLDYYKRINASYEGQIVAQKADYVEDKQGKRDAMNTYQKIVNENKQSVHANSVVNDGAGRILKEVAEPAAPAAEARQAGSERKESIPPPKKTEEKTPDLKPPDKEEKAPKAVMPKTENN